ncbi:MAG: Flp pilus assembly pilin Flp [Planctomycetota bacterium]|jgi:Flp pilus assembly pilin Flp
MERSYQMKLINLVKLFKNDESGAVTVDWVVLTAAIVGLGIAVLATVSNGVGDLAADVDTTLSSDIAGSTTAAFTAGASGN